MAAVSQNNDPRTISCLIFVLVAYKKENTPLSSYYAYQDSLRSSPRSEWAVSSFVCRLLFQATG